MNRKISLLSSFLSDKPPVIFPVLLVYTHGKQAHGPGGKPYLPYHPRGEGREAKGASLAVGRHCARTPLTAVLTTFVSLGRQAKDLGGTRTARQKSPRDAVSRATHREERLDPVSKGAQASSQQPCSGHQQRGGCNHPANTGEGGRNLPSTRRYYYLRYRDGK